MELRSVFRLFPLKHLVVFGLIFLVKFPPCSSGPVTAKQTAYDEEYAKKMLNLAAGAYAVSPDGCIKKSMPEAHKYLLLTSVNQTCDAFSNLCSYYIIVSDLRQEIIVVFRGTKSKEQLFVEGWQSTQPGADFYGIGKVNKYFFRALNTLWPGVQTVLSEARYQVGDL